MVTQPKAARRKPAKAASTRKKVARKPTRAKASARARSRPAEPRRIPITDDPQPRRRTVPPAGEAPPRTEQDAHKHSPFQPGFAPECMACPICMLFYVLKNTKPEAMEHLMKAAFELVQVGKALVEQYGERWEQAEKLERITIS